MSDNLTQGNIYNEETEQSYVDPLIEKYLKSKEIKKIKKQYEKRTNWKKWIIIFIIVILIALCILGVCKFMRNKRNNDIFYRLGY